MVIQYWVPIVVIKKSTLKDGFIFINDDNPNESVIVNFYTFVSLVKGIMIAYGNKSEGEAESIINNSAMLTLPPQNYLEACLLGHEEEYYWLWLFRMVIDILKRGLVMLRLIATMSGKVNI